MDPGFKANLPNALVSHVTGVLGDRGHEWIRQLPQLIDAVARDWDLIVGDPLEAGEFNLVAPATRSGREQVVLKISPPFQDGEYFSETAWLRNRAGDGSVRLLAENGSFRAMLLERAIPGLNLAEMFKGNELHCIGPAIRVLQSVQMPAPPSVKDVILLDNWFKRLERAMGTEFPSEYTEKALAFYHELSHKGQLSYLHGDFHPGNIVSAGREPFLAIDPKGIIGPLGYDIAVFMNNLHWWQSGLSNLRQRLDEAVRRFSTAFEISELDIRKWAFAAQVMAAWWTFDEVPALYSGGVAKADVWEV
jgi:streptomycin 6-kinase